MTTFTCNIVSVVLLGLSLSACDKPSAPDKAVGAQAPKVAASSPQLVLETGSPDLAVKSWWKVLDLMGRINVEECNKERLKEKSAHIAYFPKVAQGDLLRALTPKEIPCQEDIFDRDIQEVKTESETRAVVFVKVKNVTPVPAGAEPDKYDKQYRDEGFRFKYLVEKSSDGWKIAQVYKYDETNLILKRDVWEKVYTVSDKPRYPAFVHQH